MGTQSSATAELLDSDRSVRDWLLFALAVSSGAVDATSFLALGRVFTAFMTGNFAFLGMGIAGHAGAPDRLEVLASMAGFACGVYVATIIATPSRESATQQREPATQVVWPQRITYALAISLLPQLAFVAMWLAAAGRPGFGATRALLAIWALAMGMQSAAVR